MKGYVKDSNGKYRLVDKNEVLIVQESETQPLTLEERVKRLEGILMGPQK
jgi:hypothetical protein